ncbi:hypothetical protein LX32DRAFT_643997 [Colletotrichum zoysiae]|uniref:TIGR02453 family protein n=1 Tax=Colletotrichum zoysiae TaxID=1216348 RepID=A0AAD9LWU1_9PEZI|nr:hypothetical protein LX32DRAFT_643997 [Colletotrichum zoysiae]
MPARKRRATSPPAEVEDEPRRRSRRISSTPRKSKYFDASDEDDEFDGDAKFKDEADEPESEVDDDDDEEVEPPKKRGRGRPKGQAAKPKAKPQPKAAKAKVVKEHKAEEAEDNYQDEQPDEDDDEDDDDEGDDFEGERRVTIIPLEKLRPLGGVDYSDETVHKNTLLFLKDLKAHNQRSWLKSHDGEYRRALKDWNSFVETLTPKVTEVDFTIPELPAKDLVFRIHRDIRFSKDPTPYKAHFSAAWSRTGKKGPYACYYIHLEPGSCFIGGGLWCPEASHLQKLRESIDERPRRWRRALNDERFKRTFLPKAAAAAARKGGEEGALKAFAETNKGNALKTKPKGYLADHRDIELLKLRNFTISKKVDDRIFTEEDAQDKVCGIIAAMHPFITFLNSIVMPDPNLDEEDDSEDEGDGDQENGDGEEDGSPREETGDEDEEEGKD